MRRASRRIIRHPGRFLGAGVLLVVGVSVLSATTRRRHDVDAAPAAMREQIARDADSLDAALASLGRILDAPVDDSAAGRRVRAAFRLARARYKGIEGAIEFYAPALAGAFNARRQELDDDDAPPPSTLSPTGFPALEALMWPAFDRSHADSAQRIVSHMRALASRLHGLTPALMPTEAQVIEIARLELARAGTLGIAGFDAPRSGDAMRECAAALEGLRIMFETTGPGFWPHLPAARSDVDIAFAKASAYLVAHEDFNTFNRLAFIIAYAEPAARAVDALRRAANVLPIRIPRAWRADAAWVYAANAFDARAYAPSGTPVPSADILALGARLFVDPALSGNGTRSCASCHQPAENFADGMVTAASIKHSGARVSRNTPTLINAALQPTQFADERSVTLEDQVLEVLRSKDEMGSSVDRAATELRRRAGYDASFTRAFGGEASVAITPLRLRQALAAYVRSLVALDSRFDRAVRGDTNAMTAQERLGFTLFMGKAACGTCHFAPLFSGNTPPHYMNSDVEVIGTSRTTERFSALDADSGRARIDRLPLHYRAFKTPSLRNVAQTAPYMHNGNFRTLDDVMRFYEGGGGKGAGARIDNQTLSADSLHLTGAERKAVIAFLGALSEGVR
ncbi:MAG: cytochrome c peroxidase [bacterium]